MTAPKPPQPAPRPSYYAQGGMTRYIEGQDPEVTCGHCGKTFLCDAMDAACRLCGKFFRDAPAAPVAVPAGRRQIFQYQYRLRTEDYIAGYREGVADSEAHARKIGEKK